MRKKTDTAARRQLARIHFFFSVRFVSLLCAFLLAALFPKAAVEDADLDLSDLMEGFFCFFFSSSPRRRLSLPRLWPGECLRCVPGASQYARCLSLSPSLSLSLCLSPP